MAMENGGSASHAAKGTGEPIPALLRKADSQEVAGFDTSTHTPSTTTLHQQRHSRFHPSNASGASATKTYPIQEEDEEESQLPGHQRKHSISISMPSSPSRLEAESNPGRVFFDIEGPGLSDPAGGEAAATPSGTTTAGEWSKSVKFHSQPIPKGASIMEAKDVQGSPSNPNARKLKDDRYDSFKTWSGRLERQLSTLRGRPQAYEPEQNPPRSIQRSQAMPVDRYFDALEGPELETLKSSEEIVLPDDKTWPFLLRYPISSFGICLGVSSQAILWKTLATAKSMNFLHVPPTINIVLWCISVALVAIVASIYLLKMILFFEAVRREYYHPIRVNFFFAPWIALLFLVLGIPPSITKTIPEVLWYALMFPFLCLELKIYGQWMSGGQRRLSKVANPSNHLSVVGNFVGALLGASMGLKEGPIFFFAVGLAHYMVLFVTLYQRLPTNETLPKELHPVFFLFVAAPSVASMAWANINGSFNYGSRVAYFIALFLYFSLAVRVNFFRGFKFSLSWWAYTFPMTGAAIATIRYANEVTNVVTQALAVVLSFSSTFTVSSLLVTTVLHAFVIRDLFPNDIAIAISERKPKHHHHHHHHHHQPRWLHHLRHASSETIENYLKFIDPREDLEASGSAPDDRNY